MATKVTTVLIDDIDGSTADRTVSFEIDGKNYEIDLSAANAAALRKLLDPYMAAGRKRKSSPTRKNPTMTQGAGKPSSIREWAQRNGHPTRKRGRLPKEILEAHERATA
ncbi:Lsr2 family protein [Arthrobacter sp.]|uniref:histone-like nucleoid-structuring protein Lsr2 n=1 Tax=Arthrobacter sp. TaxID=1667 RepID=UPI0028114836|nr:Lsr2 family protein [Arthrobacter sp.]